MNKKVTTGMKKMKKSIFMNFYEQIKGKNT